MLLLHYCLSIICDAQRKPAKAKGLYTRFEGWLSSVLLREFIGGNIVIVIAIN